MIRWLSDLLWGSPPVEFESSFDLPGSIEGLKAATRRSIFPSLSRQEAVGTVTESRVSLQRVIPMVANAFKPFYRGHFVEKNGKVVLVGRFTMHPLVKVFMAFWFGVAGIGSVLATAQARQATFATLLGSVAMIAGAAALIALGKWFARNDAAWLSQVIRDALCGSVGTRATCAETAIRRIEPTPNPIVAVTTVLILLAAICWIGAIFGIQSARIGTHGSIITHFPSPRSRFTAAGFGATFLMLAYGVYRRRLIAWRAGFVLLAVSWIFSLASVFSSQSPQINLGLAIIISFVSLAVTIVWIRWWYAQRLHFQN